MGVAPETSQEPRFQRPLDPEVLDFARSIYGDLPTPELTQRFNATCEEYEISRFGSLEAADAFWAQMRKLEADLIQDHKELERRVRAKNWGALLMPHSHELTR
jgi:hypothetical protein